MQPAEGTQAAQNKPAVKTQPLDSGKLFDQNLIPILMGGAVAILLLAFIMRKKKASRQLDELGDENFAPPTKLNKRK